MQDGKLLLEICKYQAKYWSAPFKANTDPLIAGNP